MPVQCSRQQALLDQAIERLLVWMRCHPLTRKTLSFGKLLAGHIVANLVSILTRRFVTIRCREVEPHVGLHKLLRNASAN
jgi:hypothetical protein